MLIIRREQMDAFRSEARRARARSVLELAPQSARDATPSTAEALARVEVGLESARSLGFLGPAHQERFALLSLRHGPGFESEPWAHAVLWDAGLTTDQRLVALEDASARHHEGRP
ncbi:hypothetical protein JY651_12405 [Pyxidicoccus parkwayensis]|uniref:Uncharacterized protein n=1 Tax=Pyxidicoccus parkwayensis TaxID=2813578 RepID=A0ABX7P5L9_9BACT|nr:hypothetical protein [Pyxidicoccus parkwaysis]QSQ25677.1 hypothetical protein JY651_12405 [Pyxidicoccus parkwaysis]